MHIASLVVAGGGSWRHNGFVPQIIVNMIHIRERNVIYSSIVGQCQAGDSVDDKQGCNCEPLMLVFVGAQRILRPLSLFTSIRYPSLGARVMGHFEVSRMAELRKVFALNYG